MATLNIEYANAIAPSGASVIYRAYLVEDHVTREITGEVAWDLVADPSELTCSWSGSTLTVTKTEGSPPLVSAAVRAVYPGPPAADGSTGLTVVQAGTTAEDLLLIQDELGAVQVLDKRTWTLLGQLMDVPQDIQLYVTNGTVASWVSPPVGVGVITCYLLNLASLAKTHNSG
ncbi:MAG: hypothetical protein R3B70_03920 [Polyangiaceae bacterium]